MNGTHPHKIVETTLNYHLEPSKGGADTIWLGTVGERRRAHQPVPVQVKNIRGHEEDFTLDVQGFQVVSNTTTEKTFDDDERIKQVYYAECAELLKRATGASWAKGVGHTIRKKSWDTALSDESQLPDMHRVSGPTNARFVHVDQSYAGAVDRLPTWLDEEQVAKAKNCRWGIINVWRAIEPVRRDNLCMCDARSVRDEELVECRVKFASLDASSNKQADGGKDYKNAYVDKKDNLLWEVRPPQDGAKKHRWHYVSGLTPDEALLLKIFDTKSDGTARRVPHTAFKSPDDFGPTRQSLEVRCVVMWEDQAAE